LIVAPELIKVIVQMSLSAIAIAAAVSFVVPAYGALISKLLYLLLRVLHLMESTHSSSNRGQGNVRNRGSISPADITLFVAKYRHDLFEQIFESK
jgi:hypothetical protein